MVLELWWWLTIIAFKVNASVTFNEGNRFFDLRNNKLQ